MDRKTFLKRLGLSGITAVVAQTGLSKEYIEKNVKVEKDIQYVEFDLIPGQRFVFDPKITTFSDSGKQAATWGYVTADVNIVKDYWHKGIYVKDSRGVLIEYEKAILPNIGWEEMMWLNNNYSKPNNIEVYNYWTKELIVEFNTNNINTVCEIMKLKKEFVEPVLKGYRTHHNGYIFKYKSREINSDNKGLVFKSRYDTTP